MRKTHVVVVVVVAVEDAEADFSNVFQVLAKAGANTAKIFRPLSK